MLFDLKFLLCIEYFSEKEKKLKTFQHGHLRNRHSNTNKKQLSFKKSANHERNVQQLHIETNEIKLTSKNRSKCKNNKHFRNKYVSLIFISDC